jgi:hypothetical protein
MVTFFPNQDKSVVRVIRNCTKIGQMRRASDELTESAILPTVRLGCRACEEVEGGAPDCRARRVHYPMELCTTLWN